MDEPLAAPPVSSPSPRAVALLDRLRRGALRLSTMLPFDAGSEEDGPALFEPDPRARVALVTHFDATSDSLGTVVADTRNLRAVFDRVVYVTDHPEFAVLRLHGCIFEFVPPREQQVLFDRTAPWGDFLADRRALLVAKWRPRSVIAFGTSFDEIIERARKDL
ncbi:hypothetical protein [Aureimonas leprariae]|uniref:Uncharacterized protein n=1 Tax=Plantimonas leprariae TaxID=2615207 RepID=A0A7V7TXT5_9HYPH|nr:hypothetical protein [Aureimonas leprariae]KAB0681351.1 hypothetical protein F6X38_05555 [Aureimonas leprariae]